VDRDFFAGKKVLVMGLGRFGGGVDTARFASECAGSVFVTDLATEEQLQESIKALEGLKGIEYHLGGHRKEDFAQADVVIVNPAIEPDNEYLAIARANEVYVTSAMNIFFKLCKGTIIGITGANGKSTTAALTEHILKAGASQGDVKYGDVYLSGNIGNRALLGTLDKIGRDDLVVLEISSFQAERLAEIEAGPRISLLTNLTANHLDRHKSFEAYCSAKENIFKLQKPDSGQEAVSIFNGEDAIASSWYEKYKKEDGRVCLKYSAVDVSEGIRQVYTLPGRANLSNLAGAMAIARYFCVGDEAIKKNLGGFKALEHRLEFVAEIDGVRFYNDSIATTPESTMAAIEAFEQGVVLIAGGYDKGLGFDELAKLIANRTKAVVLIGNTAGKIADAVSSCPGQKPKITIAATLEEAVKISNRLAEKGDVVLLSPACASYDMFDNFQQRGNEFVDLVKNI